MGAQNQPISTQAQSQNQQISSSRHQRFAQANLIKTKDENLYFEVSQSIANLSTYTQWEKKITDIKKKIGPHSLYFPIQCQYQQQGFCGSSGTLKFKFQYFAFLLDEQISNRQSQIQPFQQKQIWFLLYILTQTAAQLHKVNYLVGDIHPKNIFINHSGDISVYSMHSFPEDFTNFQKVVFFKETNYLRTFSNMSLAPEGVNDIQTGKQSPSYDETLGQSFSIGLTILNAIFLTDFSFLYDKMERFNQIAFLKILSSLRDYQMSEKLKSVVLSLLQINPSKRFTCIEVCEYLSPYQKQIFELQEFQIQNQLKKKVKNSVDQSPAKQADNIQTQSQRQSFNKTISLHGSAKKRSSEKTPKLSLNPNEVKCRQQDSYDKIVTEKFFAYNLQAGPLSKQALLANDKSIQETFLQNVAHLKIELKTQFNNNEIESTQFANNPTEQILNSQLSPQKINTAPIMIFKTGNLFQKQKSTNSILKNDHSFSSNIDANLVESRKIDYSQIPYNQNQQFNNLKTYESHPSTNLTSESKDQYNDFLKKIQKQIEQSRKMFPDL